MTFKVVVERGEDGYFVVHCPALPACWSQGRSRESALANVREAIELYLEQETGEAEPNSEREVVELAL